MQVTAFREVHLSGAARLFSQNFGQLWRAVPEVPIPLQDPARVKSYLQKLLARSPGLVALEGGRLVGYMGWFIVDNFRGTDRKAAYCPEWGHAAVPGTQPQVYRALYREAAAQWASQGCRVHAITLLASEPATEKVWFWNGFGLTVVDAIRRMQPLSLAAPPDFSIRKATREDAEAVIILDAEHWRHYAAAPIFMVPQTPDDAASFESFIEQPQNSVWLAMEADHPAGFMRFEAESDGAAAVVQSKDTIAITGAYIRPEYRGRRLAAAILDAALQHYAGLGFGRCSVDFESFNPEAANFWMKYFEPVCLSMVRVPER